MVVTSSELKIEIDRQNVCRYLGYDADSEPPSRISSLIEEYAEEAYHLIVPSYTYVLRDIERIQNSRVFIRGLGDLLSNTIVFESDVIAQLLGQCPKVGVLLVTIGDHLEDTTCRLAEDGLILQASVLDAIGSDAVEKVADFVQGIVQEISGREGFVVSRRFSPGYCDWDITQQRGIFRIVNGDSIGVHLTDRCLMTPGKSISGVVGICPPNGGVERHNPCRICNKDNCDGRR